MSLPETVITDAGPLIALGKLARLDLLAALYTVVQVPQAVYDETVTRGLARREPEALGIQMACHLYSWPILPSPQQMSVVISPGVLLGDGEIQALNAASSTPAALVLIDDEAAREEARRLGLKVKGTLGVLVQAYQADLISRQELETLIEMIALRRDIWIKAELCQRVLAQLP